MEEILISKKLYHNLLGHKDTHGLYGCMLRTYVRYPSDEDVKKLTEEIHAMTFKTVDDVDRTISLHGDAKISKALLLFRKILDALVDRHLTKSKEVYNVRYVSEDEEVIKFKTEEIRIEEQ